MSVYTPLPQSVIKQFLSLFDVGSYVRHEDILSGTDNSNFFIETTVGMFVLTLFESRNTQQLMPYLSLLKELSRNGIPCPPPISSTNNTHSFSLLEKPAVLFPKLSGRHTTTPSHQQLQEISKLVAKIHLDTSCQELTLYNPFDELWHSKTIKSVQPILSPGQATLLHEEWRFQQQACKTLPTTLIHADIFKDNVLFNAEQVSGLLDFYYAYHGSPLQDIAILINDWCYQDTKSQYDLTAISIVLEAYQSIRPLALAEKTALPQVVRQSCLRFWISRLRAKQLSLKNTQVLIKDPTEYENKLVLSRQLKLSISEY